MRLLLLSNSSSDAGFLTHARDWIAGTLGDAKRVFFVPFAGVTLSWDSYTDRVREALDGLGLTITGAHEDGARVEDADAVLIGGGNSFALLRELYARDLLDPIRARVSEGGAPYVGWSAGANVAGPTIRTTNDMPVVQPPSLDALGLVPFQINPHYTDAHPPGHRGETRAQRLAEFVVLNPGVAVVGMPEGTALQVSELAVERLGPHPVRVFGLGDDARDEPATDLSYLLVSGVW